MNPIVVDLDEKQNELAIQEAYRRHFQSKQLQQKPRQGGPAQDARGLQIDIAGAIGEMAVAKCLGLEDFVFTFNKNWGTYDLPPNLDVKTALGHSRRLHIFKDEKPNKIFVLATFAQETIKVWGWSYGGDVMLDEFIDNPTGRGDAYFVPSKALQPITTLKAYLSDLGYCK